MMQDRKTFSIPKLLLAALVLLAGAALFASGCKQAPAPQAENAKQVQPNTRQEARQDARQLTKEENADRDEINEVPPPSKGRYLSVHTAEGWANPFLTVHRDTVELRIIFPPTAGSAGDSGSLLRPEAARKQVLDVRLRDLPDALAAVPGFAWPYGRVVAVQESAAAKRQDQAQVRRTEEATIQILNNLGVVVDEWTGSNNSLMH